MTLLGLDFDNTIVCYDELFYKIAREKNLIGENTEKTKIAIRKHLQEKGMDHIFTLLQGEAYGPRILEAKPAEGMLETLYELKEREIPMIIVSHKTKTPYAGPKYNLHDSALDWLEYHNFFAKYGMNWERSRIYLESTKESKIARITSTNCTHYIDDLPDILEMLPDNITKIHYNPRKEQSNAKNINIRHWSEATEIMKDKMA